MSMVHGGPGRTLSLRPSCCVDDKPAYLTLAEQPSVSTAPSVAIATTPADNDDDDKATHETNRQLDVKQTFVTMTPHSSSRHFDNSSSTATEADGGDREIDLFAVTRSTDSVEQVMAGSGESGDDPAGGDLLMPVDGPGSITVAASVAAADRSKNPLSISYVTAVFVLAFLCLVLGVVYGYLHYTKVNARWSRRLFGGGGGTHIGGGPGNAGDAHGPRSTHIFLSRNNNSSTGSGNPKSIQSL